MLAKRIVVAFAAASALFTSTLSPANATEETVPATTSATENTPQTTQGDADLEQIAVSIKGSDLPRETREQDGVTYTSYTLESGMKFNVPDTATPDPADGGISPFLSAGPAIDGPWVELTPMEQEMVAGGGAAALTALICASGPWSCAVASAITVALGIYIANYGVCPNNQRLLVEFTWSGQVRGSTCR